ncbi:MAG: hypothetical protein ACYTFW_01910 [Planctomycetota bacterium]
MKSIKYIIIIVFFLVVSSQAEYIYEYDWPRYWVEVELEQEQEALAVNQVPVRIEIPPFVQVLNAKDLEIFLDEVDARTYEGCTDFQVISNLDIKLGCRLIINGKVRGDYSCWINDAYVQPTGDLPETRTACVRLENPKYYYVATSSEGEVVEVAKLVLTVSPR